jgi:hypothetical protein
MAPQRILHEIGSIRRQVHRDEVHFAGVQILEGHVVAGQAGSRRKFTPPKVEPR